MRALRDLEVGVMFWAGRDPLQTIREVKALGVQAGQLGVPGDMPLEGAAAAWNSALEQEDFALATVFCSYTGESYADLPTVQQTVGFIPPATRQEREQRTNTVSDFAAVLGVKSIATHIGFVPENRTDPAYLDVLHMVRRICDHAGKNGQSFVLETGQEPADTLLTFLRDVDRTNIGINFDPANMIMYGTGDPIQALSVLAPHVVSVHCKDGVWPPRGVANALGSERPLGAGEVGMPQFIAKLKQLGYRGILSIEREIDDEEQKKADMRNAVKLLEQLRQQTA
jgi:sugar phosphate isomerase/epimerase